MTAHTYFNQILTISIIVFLILTFHSCTESTPGFTAPYPEKEVVLDNLAHPWSIAFINEKEAFISEKDGDLLRVNLETKSRQTIKGFPKDLFSAIPIIVKDYPPRTYPNSVDSLSILGNAGKLEVLLHPDFESTGEIFISYVAQKEKTFALKVIKAEVKEDSLINIVDILVPGPYVPGLWHFGGGLCIKNRQLYITVGERLFFEDLKQGLPIAQDVTDSRGAIYRLELDGSIPKDNPDFGSDAIPGIFAFGIRAAQGITTRPGTEDIWFSEHGTTQGDEINILKKEANYGWPNITSGRWRSPGYVPDSLAKPNYTAPQHFWKQTVAPTGLTFYTGTEFPSWNGNLIVPGLSRGSLWRMVLEGNTFIAAEELFLNDRVRSRKAMQSPDGQLYFLTDEDNGKLIRIINKSKTKQ